MKKIFMLLVAIAAMVFVSCSKDDDDDDGVYNGTQEGVITMVVKTDVIDNLREGAFRDYFMIESFNVGDAISIDWGDGKIEKVVTEDIGDNGEYIYWDFQHFYSNNGPHTITISGKIKGVSHVYNNALISLDVSKCPALESLWCGSDNLTSLDVSKNTELVFLECFGKLTTLDVSKNTKLEILDCGWNKLTSLDVSKCTKLALFECSDNKLTSAALNKIFTDLPQGNIWCTEGREEPSSFYIENNPGTSTCKPSIATKKGWKRLTHYY